MPKDMFGRPVVTAAELDRMTPEQRQAAFDASVVEDLDLLPEAFLAQIREDAAEALKNRLRPDDPDDGSESYGVARVS